MRHNLKARNIESDPVMLAFDARSGLIVTPRGGRLLSVTFNSERGVRSAVLLDVPPP